MLMIATVVTPFCPMGFGMQGMQAQAMGMDSNMQPMVMQSPMLACCVSPALHHEISADIQQEAKVLMPTLGLIGTLFSQNSCNTNDFKSIRIACRDPDTFSARSHIRRE